MGDDVTLVQCPFKCPQLKLYANVRDSNMMILKSQRFTSKIRKTFGNV